MDPILLDDRRRVLMFGWGDIRRNLRSPAPASDRLDPVSYLYRDVRRGDVEAVWKTIWLC
jgi:hypothetical protein